MTGRVLMWDTLASGLNQTASGLDIVIPTNNSLVELSTLFTGNAANCFFIDGVVQPLRTTVTPPGKKWTIISSGLNYKASAGWTSSTASEIQGAILFVKQDSPLQYARSAGDGLWLNSSLPGNASSTAVEYNNNSVSVAGVKSGGTVAASTAPSDQAADGKGNRYWTSAPLMTIGHAIWIQYGPTYTGDNIDVRLFILEEDLW
jgi:hypothetical protein